MDSPARLARTLLAGMTRLLGGTPRPGEPSLVTISTTGWDPSLGGYGSGLALGDLGSSALVIPPGPGDTLYRLWAYQVQPGYACRMVSFAQYLEIGATVLVEGGITPYPLTLQVTSPLWHPNGTQVTWGITTRPSILTRNRETRYGPQATDTSLDGYAPAQLIKPPPAARTEPLTRGLWPGSPVGDMGVFRDMRSPWGQNERQIDYAVPGGTTLTAWAFVRKRNPANYPALELPDGYDLGCLGPEDRFLAANPAADVSRIAGRVTLELYPDHGDTRRENL